MADAGGDELYSIKNQFWLGNFQVRGASRRSRAAPSPPGTRTATLAHRPLPAAQEAIGEARSLRLKDGTPARAERDIIVLRSLCGLRNYACVCASLITGPRASRPSRPSA